jgi:hypothetical protein
MTRKATVVICILFSVLLVGCTASKPDDTDSRKTVQSSTSNQSAVDPVADYSPQILKGLDARAALTIANVMRSKNTNVEAVVTPQEVVFTFPSGETVNIALPEDRIMIAIAPYISKTHPCVDHNLTECEGELFGVPVEVVASKATDGTVIFNQSVSTLDNGFLELWLPRNMEYKVTLVAEGRKATGRITTFKDSKTCITTFRLL